MSNIVVPQLGESVVEARVARWLKKEGDRVEVGEPLVELETEKIDLEVNADHAGVLTKIAHTEGDDVRIGEILGELDEAAPGPSGNGAAAAKSTPTARNVAKEHDVDLGTVRGSGAAGRVMKQDVESAIAPAPVAPAKAPIAPSAKAPIAPAAKPART